MIGSSGNSTRNCAEICAGDHCSSSSQDSTWARNRGHPASFAIFGRRARSQARRCARQPAYPSRPPFALTSRDTVEGARLISVAILRNESPAFRPPLMCSRSPADSLAGDGSQSSRRATPPASRMIRCTNDAERDTSRATSRGAIPSATKATIRFRSSAVSLGYRPLFAFPTTTSRSSRIVSDPPSRCSDPQNPPTVLVASRTQNGGLRF